MTALARSTPRLSAVPASQNTAPVAEFRCLFTHDVRRKQKRWQDGFLKFHTFNNRVMVYDTSRNFLGDTYWKESNELQEGDELALDKGVMVEVAEPMGVSQTDLTPLFEKKRDSPRGKTPVAAHSSSRLPPRPSVPLSNIIRNGSQLKHKSLNTLLGTPKGPIGKAVPIKSPYETRREKENEWAVDRAAKRQKTQHEPGPQTTSSPPKDSPSEDVDPPLAAPEITAATKWTAPIRPLPKPLPREVTVITLDSEPDHFASDVTLPSPQNQKSRVPTAPVSKPNTRRETPAPKTPKLPKGKVPVPHVKALQTPNPPPRASSPPVSVSNRFSHIDATIPIADLQKDPSPVPPPRREPKPKALRLASGTKRGTLLCQSLPQELPRNTREPHKASLKRKETRQAEDVGELAAFEATWPSDNDDPLILADELERPSVITKHKRKAQTRNAEKPSPKKKAKTREASPPSSPGAFEEMETIHGMMDQQLRVPSPPPKQTKSAKSKSAPALESKPTTAKKRQGKQVPTAKPHEETPASRPARLKKPRETVSSPLAVAPTIPAPELPAPDPPSKETSPEAQSRSTTTSPHKVPFSAKGLLKKRNKTTAAPIKPQDRAPDTIAPASKPAAPSLPPHPLRASRTGLLMTTTELSRALLQMPPKSIAADEDPIEDASQAMSPSPTKKLRRSQSENDAPIPSTAAEWEERNMRTTTTTKEQQPTTKTRTKASAKGGLAALVKKTDPRKKFVRTQSLSVETNVVRSASVETDIVSPPIDTDVGPWSTEAFDLFDWRPPAKEGEDAGIGLLVDKS
ncbi:hypothetical protein BDV96DRAFT_653975 [Lophiotrema nucula]|uniref:5'-3' DNA helicase ZGRF1-like N-terminal domain-containing protein n=1 Tax=Lophiotrema nucula TaxID=690887 RepID=A0A6A5YJ57_9PLEO|nr:hypothetical protein BDV96DRAFT_653975 [Lophiotrema nucula]